MPDGAEEKILPKVTAGLANEVEEVKRWPANIQAAIAGAMRLSFPRFTSCRIIRTSPVLATISPMNAPEDSLLTLLIKTSCSNIREAARAPNKAPSN